MFIWLWVWTELTPSDFPIWVHVIVYILLLWLLFVQNWGTQSLEVSFTYFLKWLYCFCFIIMRIETTISWTFPYEYSFRGCREYFLIHTPAGFCHGRFFIVDTIRVSEIFLVPVISINFKLSPWKSLAIASHREARISSRLWFLSISNLLLELGNNDSYCSSPVRSVHHLPCLEPWPF